MELQSLTDRAQRILGELVESYLKTGVPVGSRTLSQSDVLGLSAASIRHVMAELEGRGLLYAPHTSAGRLPTEAGLRLFVSGLLEHGNLSAAERASLEAKAKDKGRSFTQVLEEAGSVLSGLSNLTGLVVAPKAQARLRQIEFVALSPAQALIVLVDEKGKIENRLLEVPAGVSAGQLKAASNFLSTELTGKTLAEGLEDMKTRLQEQRQDLAVLSQILVDQGLTQMAKDQEELVFIVRGQSNLLSDMQAKEDLERLQSLLDALETTETMERLLVEADKATGVQVYLGSQSQLFGLSGFSLVLSPYAAGDKSLIGAVGVIGPTRMNYGRIVPMVDYTAQLMERVLRS